MDNDNLPLFPEAKPPRADAARNHKRLLSTARQLFQEEGVAAVTMSAVAKAAGVGKGTLYRHFPDKAQLCHALLDEAMRDFQQRTIQELQGGRDPLEHLRWFLWQAVVYVDQYSDLLREAAITGEDTNLQHPAHIWWRQTILSLLNRMHVVGDVSYTADVLYVLLDVQTIRFQREAMNYDLQRIVDGIMLVLERLTAICDQSHFP